MNVFGTDIAHRNKKTTDALTIDFVGRLDNRRALRALLGLDDGRPLDDKELVLHGYRRWGKELPERLSGDFSFLIQDPSERSLFGARDPLGAKPFYYWRDRTSLLFSADLPTLLAQPAVSVRLDHGHLASSAVLLLSLVRGGTRTLYQNIFSLPGGSALRFDAGGLRAWQYWRPDPARRLDIPDAEAPEALRALLFSAVGARLPERSEAATLLSGGLDSSSIAAVAAALLRKKNRTLTAFSAVLAAPARDGTVDEASYIKELGVFDNMRFVSVTDEHRGPFDDVEELVRASATPFHTSRHYLYSAFAAGARTRGATSVLDGCFGEMGPTTHGAGFYPELLRTGRWPLLARELRRRAQVDDVSVARAVKSHLIRPLCPSWLMRLSGRSRRFDLRQWTDGHPLAESYVDGILGGRKAELLEEVDDYLAAPGHDHRDIASRSVALMQRRAGDAFHLHREAVDFLYPFLDKKIVEFCLAAPGHLKVRDGYPRSLIRLALGGLLPKAIQWRTSKEPFSPDYHARYNRQKPRIESLLAGIARNDPVREIVDVDRLLRMARIQMRSNRCAAPDDFIGMHTVPQGIYLIAFLRRFPEFRAPGFEKALQ